MGNNDKKSKTNWSLFPNAKHVLDEYQNLLDTTIRVEVEPTLVEASQKNRIVYCEKCKASDETGLEWTKILLLSDDGNTQETVWYCNRCLDKKKDRPNTGYRYSTNEIDNSVETINIKPPKESPSQNKTNAANNKRKNNK